MFLSRKLINVPWLRMHYRNTRGGLMFRCDSMRSHGKWCFYLSCRWLPDEVCLYEAGGSFSLAVRTDTQRSLAEERIIKGATGDTTFHPEHPKHQGNVGDDGGWKAAWPPAALHAGCHTWLYDGYSCPSVLDSIPAFLIPRHSHPLHP